MKMKKDFPIVRPLEGGRFQVDWGRAFGKRVQKVCGNKEELERHIAEKEDDLLKFGNEAARLLTDKVKADAVQAVKILGSRRSLTEAAQFYSRNCKRIQGGITLSALIDEFLEAKRAANRRPDTIRDYKTRLRIFAAGREKTDVQDLTTQGIENWLNEQRYGSTSRHNYLTSLTVLLNFAMKREYLLSNPAAAIDRPFSDQGMPCIFSPSEVRALLDAAIEKRPAMLPYLTIGLFAGIRPAELRQLHRADVDLKEKYIRVTAVTAKRRRQRLVDISSNLLAWLCGYPITGETVFYSRRAKEAIRSQAEVEWGSDILRHTFASYHLAHHENAAKTSLLMGHVRADILFDHYRNLVTKKEAREFWSIRPEAGENVIRLPSTA